MKGITPNSTRNNYYGTTVDNNSNQYIPEDVLEAAIKVRQLLIDYKLNVKLNIKHPDYEA